MAPSSYDALIKVNRSRVSPKAADEPVVRLHEPDLPWKLEPETPSSATARSRSPASDAPQRPSAPSMSPKLTQALLDAVGDAIGAPSTGSPSVKPQGGTQRSPSRPKYAPSPLVASRRDRPAPPPDEIDWSG
jgi:hypothetical protein